MLDTTSSHPVLGLDVLRVGPREGTNKYLPRPKDMPDDWPAKLGVQAAEWKPSHGRGIVSYDSWLWHIGVQPSLYHILSNGHKLNNRTLSLDGTVTASVKHFGHHALQLLLRPLCTPLREWPPEIRQVLYFVLHKKDGFDLNKDSQPIKLPSTLFHLLAKLLCPHLQHAIHAPVSGGRRFTGYRGGFAIGMCRMVRLLLT